MTEPRDQSSAASEDALEETKGRIARAIYEVSNRWIQGNFPEGHEFLDFSEVDERTCNLHFDYADAVLAVMPDVAQPEPQCSADSGHTEASGYAASLRQMAAWHDAGEDDIDVDELRAAADYIERTAVPQTLIGALQEIAGDDEPRPLSDGTTAEYLRNIARRALSLSRPEHS